MTKGNRDNHQLIQSCDWHRYNKYINPNKSKYTVILPSLSFYVESIWACTRPWKPPTFAEVALGHEKSPSLPTPAHRFMLPWVHSSRMHRKSYNNFKAFHGYFQGAGVIPTIFIFLGSGTGVSGRVCVMSLDSSDACLWTVSLDCTFGERSVEWDFWFASEGWSFDAASPPWVLANSSPSWGFGGRSFICGFGGKSPSCGFGGKSPSWGFGGSSPGFGGKSPTWGFWVNSRGRGFGGKSPGCGFCGISMDSEGFWNISMCWWDLSIERWWLVSIFLSATKTKKQKNIFHTLNILILKKLGIHQNCNCVNDHKVTHPHNCP